MNYFFALALPNKTRGEVNSAAAEWQSLTTPPRRAKWLHFEDYHLTLLFLGDLPISREGRLIEIAAPLAEASFSFPVQLGTFDAFENLTWPRTLYISVERNEVRIELTKQLQSAFAEEGYTLDKRPPRPHVTVARHCREKDRSVWPGWPVPGERLFSPWQATEFVLMQTLPPDKRENGAKARYNTVHAFPFVEKLVSDVS